MTMVKENTQECNWKKCKKKNKIHVDKFFQIGKEHEDTVAYIKVYQNMT